MDEMKDAVKFAAMIDHTNLKADAGKKAIHTLCAQAEQYGFASVMVNPIWVSECAAYLKNSTVAVGTVCGFPLGASTVETKIFEAENAIKNGAGEVDYVLSIGRLKDGDLAYIQEEMTALTAACHAKQAVVKVIFENCCLTQKEIIAAAKIACLVQPDFIKTSTGFGDSGASVADVQLMYDTAGSCCQVKAAGGIRNWQNFKAMVEAGATRIGTSGGIEILSQFKVARD